ncbi:unnamed protein product [Danaus chrysippus]|uniref:(African queen) hypothetical protein n=1 Tax=Danaus chrysippus TaxID=151541 RepID=A0A8J2VV99_9NEOP|nr:unnamed protein product [Danaus chrysippus]
MAHSCSRTQSVRNEDGPDAERRRERNAGDISDDMSCHHRDAPPHDTTDFPCHFLPVTKINYVQSMLLMFLLQTFDFGEASRMRCEEDKWLENSIHFQTVSCSIARFRFNIKLM